MHYQAKANNAESSNALLMSCYDDDDDVRPKRPSFVVSQRDIGSTTRGGSAPLGRFKDNTNCWCRLKQSYDDIEHQYLGFILGENQSH